MTKQYAIAAAYFALRQLQLMGEDHPGVAFSDNKIVFVATSRKGWDRDEISVRD